MICDKEYGESYQYYGKYMTELGAAEKTDEEGEQEEYYHYGAYSG